MRSNYPERKTILCIDDDGGMLDYQKALLERRGYKVPLRTPPDKAYRLQQSVPLLP
jgi:DNA-binding NtrC family response regulator